MLIANIPYMSFPIRSIDNWINRLQDPFYMRIMSDIMDGVYSQYADEDEQYDEYTKYMMQSGWLPLFKGYGVRLGHGALDVQSLVSSGGSVITQRQRPILRALSTLVLNQDVEKALSQLASVGVISRVANTIAPRELAQNIPVIRQNVSKKDWGLFNASSMLFEYTNYQNTPYKYRQRQPVAVDNGRYTRYENIYNQWFNKYGRMRVPPTDPLSLVKDTQWKQYVRYRQSRNMMYYR